MTDEQFEEATSLREDGWQVPTIARRYGISPGALSWRLLAVGAEAPHLEARVLPQTRPGPIVVMRNGRPVRSYSPQEDALIQALDREGCGYSDIGRRLDPPRAANSVQGRLMTLARHEARREAAFAAQSVQAAE